MVEIKNFGDLSLQEAQNLLETESSVRVFNPETQSKTKFYKLNEYIQTKQAVLDFFKDMPEVPKDAPNRDMLIFTYAYTKLSYMVKYDEIAVKASMSTGYQRDMAEHLLDNAANAYGGLILNSSLCSGYSDTLKVLLESQGINCKEISGGSRTRGEQGGAHAWNQVCLDGVWYNCDLTNDCDFILQGLQAPYFLKSNAEFNRYEKYPVKNQKIIEDAKISITSEEQEKLIENARQLVLAENKTKEQANTSKTEKTKPGFIQKVMAMFSKKKDAEVEKYL